MDWQELAKTIASAGLPILGGAVGGPGGAVIGKMISSALGLSQDSSPAEIATTMASAPDSILKLRELELKHEEFMVKAAYDAEVAHAVEAAKQVDSVNKTLQTEAMGGSWLQRNHHAMESLAVVGMVIGVYFLLPLLKLPVPVIPEFAFMMLGAILGVTAWQRGQANNTIAKSN